MEAKEPILDRATPANFAVRSEQIIRENQIAIETLHIIRKQLAECTRRENINQAANCREVREKYWALCLDKNKGMLFPPGTGPESPILPGYMKKTSNSN